MKRARKSRELLPIVFVIIAFHAGCAASGGGARVDEDRTGGISMEMLVRDAGGALWLYEVRADGTLAYAGGADAAQRRITWTGEMTDEEIRALRELLAQHGWLTGPRSELFGEGERRYMILVRGPGAFERIRFEVRGEREDAAEVDALLRRIALRRLDPELERLPKPGPVPR